MPENQIENDKTDCGSCIVCGSEATEYMTARKIAAHIPEDLKDNPLWDKKYFVCGVGENRLDELGDHFDLLARFASGLVEGTEKVIRRQQFSDDKPIGKLSSYREAANFSGMELCLVIEKCIEMKGNITAEKVANWFKDATKEQAYGFLKEYAQIFPNYVFSDGVVTKTK